MTIGGKVFFHCGGQSNGFESQKWLITFLLIKLQSKIYIFEKWM